jgi:hypothetical protein
MPHELWGDNQLNCVRWKHSMLVVRHVGRLFGERGHMLCKLQRSIISGRHILQRSNVVLVVHCAWHLQQSITNVLQQLLHSDR